MTEVTTNPFVDLKVSRDDYRSHPAINYSKLAALSRHPSNLLREVEQTEPMLMGNLVDTLITDKENFNNLYHTMTSMPPEPSIKAVVEGCIAHVKEINDGTIPLNYPFESSPIIEVADSLSYQTNWKEDTRLNKILQYGASYFDELCRVGEKTVVSPLHLADAKDCADVLVNHEFTKAYFTGEVYYQVPLLFTYCDLDFKVLLDGIRVDRGDKTIRPFDIKTSSDNPNSFKYKVLKWRYDIQEGMYSKAVKECIKGTEFEDYTILPFQFIVGSFNASYPVKYQLNDNLEREYEFMVRDNPYKGWVKLAQDLQYHVENELYDYTKDQYDDLGLEIIEL